MGSAFRYWRLIRLDGSGRRRLEEVTLAKTFFFQQFPDLFGQSDVPDLPIQKHLMNLIRSDRTSTSERDLAERCLRCYISHHIEQACLKLETQFQANYGLSRHDLFPLVLDDDGRPKLQIHSITSYRTLATKVLQSFDPDQATLSTWTSRLVRQHEELNRFLRERGIFLISDWALLNNTQPHQLQRILTAFHVLTETEIEQTCQLLQTYHEIYRAERLQKRQAGQLKGRVSCAAPTTEQLDRMTKVFQTKTAISCSKERLLKQLQVLANQLRQYRLYQQGGDPLLVDSLDHPEIQARAVVLAAPEFEPDQEIHHEFLQFYRQQLSLNLDQAIEKATHDRVTYLKQKSSQTAQHFLLALHLFHCQNQSMGEIAKQIGLEAQYKVTRLMKLKEFRDSVRQNLLKLLLEQVLEEAKSYANLNRIHTLDQQIETALDEQVSSIIHEAEVEAAAAKRKPLMSLFALRLCQYLDAQLDSQRIAS